MSKSSFKYSPLSLSCCIVLVWAERARAAEPSCELECLRGYECQMLTICPDGPVSDNLRCQPSPTCVAVPCSSDADCEERMVCYDDTTDETPSMCLPDWQMQCTSDADCGAGFTCAQEIPCLDPAQPDCEPQGVFLCYIHTQTCQADTNCLPDWTCQNNPINSFWVSSPDGAMGCGIVEPALVCLPPYAPQFGLGAGFLDWQTGVEWSSRKVPLSECPEPRSQNVPHTSSGAGVPQEASSNEGPTSLDTDPREPAVQNDAPEANGSALPALPTATNNGGCSLGGVAANTGRGVSAFALLGALGLAGMAASRRRAVR